MHLSLSSSLSLFLSLSFFLSLLYSPCVLSIYSTTYMYHLKSSLQVIQSVVQSYDTLTKSVVSKHHQKYYWKLSIVPTYYLLSIYLLSIAKVVINRDHIPFLVILSENISTKRHHQTYFGTKVLFFVPFTRLFFCQI